MSEEIKPKKERRFLKTLGRVGEILVEQVLLKLGSSIIKKIGGKKTLPSILFIFLSFTLFAQYPNTGNKQRLGFQTTADGLTWRGSLSDTASIQPINNQNAWVILDTVNLKFYSFDFTSNAWNLVGGAPGLTMPFDSITFNTAKNGTVGVGEVEYNNTQGSLIQGLKGGDVTNVIGQQLHQRVNNRTGATLTKGTAVYLSGSQGNRITVAKALGVTDAFSANTFGIVAESIENNQSGYVITEGLMTNINTSALTEDSAVYLSPTVAGGLTSTKPQAPQHTVYIGVCVKSNPGSGELFVKIRNGQELDELHDVRITSPVDKSSLYYSGGLWRDTTAALLTSDTASMLTNYLRTGTAASTYQAKLNGTGFVKASGTNITYDNSTYLPLTGGILTGGLTGTTALFSGSMAIGFPFAYKPLEVISNANDFVSVGVRELGQFQYSGIHFGYRQPNTDYRSSAIVFQRNEISPYIDATGKIHLLNVSYGNGGRSADLRDAKLTISNIGGYVGINDTSPEYQLDVNGTLGVTGATTLTGLLKNTSQRLTGNITISDFDANFNSVQTGPSSSTTVNLAIQQNVSGAANISMGGAQGGGGEPFNPNIYFTDNRKAYASIGGIHTSSGTNNQSGHIVFNTTPSLNTIALTERMRIAQDGAITIGGTLGVTGATTLSSTLAVTGATTLSNLEGTITRMVTVSSTGLLSAQAIPSGTVTSVGGTGAISSTGGTEPVISVATAALGTAGIVSSTGTQQFSGDKVFSGTVTLSNVSAPPTSLLGKDGSNVVGEVTTLAQTGLMTRGLVNNASTISGSELIEVTHNLGSNPTSVLVTVFGSTSYILQVASKSSSIFTVQVKNYDGTAAIDATLVSFSWLAIK